jgi:predicted CXXCH cytochrome family protein
MSLGNRLIWLAAFVLTATIAAAAMGRPGGRSAPDTGRPEGQPLRTTQSDVGPDLQVGPLPTKQADVSADYAGSKACAECHDVEHDQWARSLHIRMTKPAAEALMVGNFDNVSFADHGRAYRMESRDGRRYISVSHGGGPFETFEVHYTLGAKRFQGYLSRLPDGRIYVLPVFWNVAQRRWLDWKEITPVPDGAHDLRQIWNVTCFNCHATNLDAKFDVATRTYNTAWTEMGLGCETCHGPGRPHIELMRDWEKNPSTKPAYDTSASNRALGPALKIFSPRTAEPRQVFDVCAYCHGNKNNLFLGFLPGRRMEDFALPFLVSQPMPADDPQGDFWPDGRPSRFNRPQALTLSGCFIKGNITCTNCHVAHGSRQEHSLKVAISESDNLCTQCHETVKGRGADPGARGELIVATTGAELERHTHHPVGSQGSRCIECHMSDVNWRLLIRRRDHTFAAPVPEMTAKYGVPNGCNTCHDNRTPEWASKTMDAWYGDGARRASAMRLAEAFYLAGAGDPASLPTLASLAVDRSRGMLVRASAAEFIGQVYVTAAGKAKQVTSSGPSQTSLDRGFAENNVPAREGTRSSDPGPRVPDPGTLTPELTTRLINSLIGAMADPEPTVRAVATRSLGMIADPRGSIPIIARLRDDVRTVRTAAAEALLWMNITTLPGNAGEFLARAQDEFGASLAAFPDVVGNHATRGWLESERGRQERAAQVLDTALALDPQYVRAHVYRGIVAARAGELAAAIKHWRTAKKIDPEYPNIDRMIAEAERQASQPR